MTLRTTSCGPSLPYGVDDGVVEAGFFLGLAQAALVGLDVVEVERVSGPQLQVDQFVAGLEQVVDALRASIL